MNNPVSSPVPLGLTILISACGAVDTADTTSGDVADAGAPGSSEIALAPGIMPAEMAARVEQFAPVTLTFDATLLDERQLGVVRRLIEAADILDGIFLGQVWEGNPSLEAELAGATFEGADAAREYFRIMYGPWDRLEDDEPFLDVRHKPAGAGYYPENLTREEMEAWLETHPEDAEAFTSYYTKIARDGDGLVAVPYGSAYATELEAAATLLREAAELADNPSLRRYLETRADAFRSDDYYESDVAWMRLEDNLVDPTIGPYEVYEDNLFGYKAAFEAFITIRDPAESAKLDRLAAFMPDLERALPIPEKHKSLDKSFAAPISVVTEVYAAGDTRNGVQTLAFNLPNDARVRAEEGSKKVMLTNIVEAKFEQILKPIAATLLDREQADDITFEPYFTRILMHELAHALGPDYVTDQPELTVNKALMDRYSATEEAKADVVGTHSLSVLAAEAFYEADFIRQVHISHAVDMFRCVRFGASEAHGKGCLMQLNYLMERRAITHDPASGTFRVDLDIMPGAIADLAGEFLTFQATGDYDGLGVFMERYGSVSDVLRSAIDRLDAVPVDIRPEYAVREMMVDW